MLAVTLRAGRLLDRRGLLRRARRRWASAATCAARSSTGSATFSAREVTQFGAPSLITRTTNDVQQVQMLVLMTCTLLVAAPIMCDRRHHHGAARRTSACPGCWSSACRCSLIAIGADHRRGWCRSSGSMQTRIDARQPGAARADHRHPGGPRVRPRAGRDRSGSRAANADLTDTALRAGRLMALMFPIVMLVLNVSSVAVLWFGAHRVDAGEMQIGALTAFLSYLMQILMAVMMATFMAVMIPRAAVCADRISEVLDTESSVVPPAEPGARRSRATRHARAARRRASATRAPTTPVLRDISLHRRAPGRRRRSSAAPARARPRWSPDPAAVRRDRRRGAGRRRRRPRARPRGALERASAWCRSGRTCSPARSRSNLRYGKPDATDEELWAALEIAQAQRLRRGDAGRARRADRPGRHQRLRRPAPAAGDRPGAGAAARDLPVRRLVLRARPRHRRAAARRAATA